MYQNKVGISSMLLRIASFRSGYRPTRPIVNRLIACLKQLQALSLLGELLLVL
jgi:hypothetical protein